MPVEPFKASETTIGYRKLRNDYAVGEIGYSYGVAASLKQAASRPLSPELSATEKTVLANVRAKWDGMLTTSWNKTLLYGDVVKYMPLPQHAAFIKLVRRGLVKLYDVSTPQGSFTLWEVEPNRESNPMKRRFHVFRDRIHGGQYVDSVHADDRHQAKRAVAKRYGMREVELSVRPGRERNPIDTIKVGDRVTKQPRKWHDGTPVKGWPDPQFIGTVIKIERSKYGEFIRVHWASGRKDLASARELTVIRESNPLKFDRCVQEVKRRGGRVNPYAVCTAAGTRRRK